MICDRDYLNGFVREPFIAGKIVLTKDEKEVLLDSDIRPLLDRNLVKIAIPGYWTEEVDISDCGDLLAVTHKVLSVLPTLREGIGYRSGKDDVYRNSVMHQFQQIVDSEERLDEYNRRHGTTWRRLDENRLEFVTSTDCDSYRKIVNTHDRRIERMEAQSRSGTVNPFTRQLNLLASIVFDDLQAGNSSHLLCVD